MRRSLIPLVLAAGALALSACNSQNQAHKDEAAKGSEAVKQAGDKTIAAGIDQNSSFFKATKAAGLDATLAGPGPYTVIVPDDAAFAKLPEGTLDGWMKPIPLLSRPGRIILPAVLPAVLTGFTLAFARGIGEYGSVVFISGNLPMKTEITPLLIVIKLEQFEYQAAAALGLAMLVMSFIMLFAINLVQAWGRRRHVAAGR